MIPVLRNIVHKYFFTCHILGDGLWRGRYVEGRFVEAPYMHLKFHAKVAKLRRGMLKLPKKLLILYLYFRLG